MTSRVDYVVSEEHKFEHGEYTPCFIAKGHTGYRVTTWNFGPIKEHATELCDRYNRASALTDGEVAAMLNRAIIEGRARSRSRR